MGRTLHFSVTNVSDITNEEKEIMYNVSQSFNSKEFENVWTCENFFLDPLSYYPNWENEKIKKSKNAWKLIEKESEKLLKENLSRLELRKKLHSLGLIEYLYDPEKEIWGFCKVGGNEFNAFLVYMALIEISQKTKAVIKLSDEGEFLYCPLLIKNGLVKANKKEIEENWKYWEEKGWINTNQYHCRDKMKKQGELLKLGWKHPLEFCRKVNPKDFETHPQYGVTEIMKGFYGEYWGLDNEKDAETEALKIAAMLQKTFGKGNVLFGCDILNNPGENKKDE